MSSSDKIFPEFDEIFPGYFDRSDESFMDDASNDSMESSESGESDESQNSDDCDCEDDGQLYEENLIKLKSLHGKVKWRSETKRVRFLISYLPWSNVGRDEFLISEIFFRKMKLNGFSLTPWIIGTKTTSLRVNTSLNSWLAAATRTSPKSARTASQYRFVLQRYTKRLETNSVTTSSPNL
ncbi:unnamed protein product [Trichogramma brassicae]|uniref:Uncharacterized protein n=1 Tax=Trichogramma brassicae TaxID=86971 RepID=A0A6H5IIT1_9HYME|nr:unnamed protein product [Trichogramma brassicae]